MESSKRQRGLRGVTRKEWELKVTNNRTSNNSKTPKTATTKEWETAGLVKRRTVFDGDGCGGLESWTAWAWRMASGVSYGGDGRWAKLGVTGEWRIAMYDGRATESRTNAAALTSILQANQYKYGGCQGLFFFCRNRRETGLGRWHNQIQPTTKTEILCRGPWPKLQSLLFRTTGRLNVNKYNIVFVTILTITKMTINRSKTIKLLHKY